MKGLFTEQGRTLCSMRTTSGILKVTSSDKLMGFLGRSNLTSSTPSKFLKACPVLCRIAVPEIGTGTVKIWKSSKAGKPVDDFLKVMEKSRGVKVRVLEEQPDEQVENSPRECHASHELFKDIQFYREGIASTAESVGEARDLSGILIQTRLPDTMWGIKEVKKALAEVQSDAEMIKDNIDQLEIAVETSEKKTGILASMIEKGLIKKGTEMVAGLIKDFFIIKETLSKMAQVLHPLSVMDETFRKATGYPMTWVFDPSTFYDFQLCYDKLMKNFVRLAKSEQSIIEPLFVWKVQNTGEKDGRLFGT